MGGVDIPPTVRLAIPETPRRTIDSFDKDARLSRLFLVPELIEPFCAVAFAGVEFVLAIAVFPRLARRVIDDDTDTDDRPGNFPEEKKDEIYFLYFLRYWFFVILLLGVLFIDCVSVGETDGAESICIR